MAELSSFFNSVGGDRKYRAEDWAEYFSALIGNGFVASDSSALQVIPGNGLNVVVRPGRAFVNGYFYNNTSDLAVDLPVADGTLARIDRIVVRLSHAERRISVSVKSSAVSSNPAPAAIQRDNEVWELAIADVRVNPGATALSAAEIIDRRLDVALCGPVVGIIDQIDTEEFGAQIYALVERLEQTIQDAGEGTIYLLKTGGTMTGPLNLDIALGVASGGTGVKTMQELFDALGIESYVSGRIAQIADLDVEVS